MYPDRIEASAGLRFTTAAEAWLWAFFRWHMRHQPRHFARNDPDERRRVCTPDDVLNAVQHLVDAGRLTQPQLLALRLGGESGEAPKRNDVVVHWHAAMRVITPALVARGIVRTRAVTTRRASRVV